MKQLSKLESAIFLLGGVLMVVGAACFAFGFSHPQLVQVTSWGFLPQSETEAVFPFRLIPCESPFS